MENSSHFPQTSPTTKPGLILLAHGSRDALWRQPIEAVQQAVAEQQPELPCLCAYLDACAPDLPSAAAELLSQGVNHFTVLPLFLGTGKHAREDIPRLIEVLRQQHPHCRFEVLTAAGEDPRITALLADMALKAIGARPAADSAR